MAASKHILTKELHGLNGVLTSTDVQLKKPMPTQSRGFWACDYCRSTFDAFEEARYHEIEECPSNPSRFAASYPPPDAAAMAPYSPEKQPPLHSYEYDNAPMPRGKLRRFPLMSPRMESHLTEADTIACQNLELFETQESTPQSDQEFRRTVAQVGLRCLACATSRESSAGAEYSLPRTIGSLGDAVRRMSDRHLMQCKNMGEQERLVLGQAVKQRQSSKEEGGPAWHEDEGDRRALADFCTARCQQLQVVNKQPENSGIEFREADLPLPAGAAAGWPPATPPPHFDPRVRHEMGPPIEGYSTTPMSIDRYSAGPLGRGPAFRSLYGPAEPPVRGPPAYMSMDMPPAGPETAGYFRQQPFDLPSNFPFYQDAMTGDWFCKYCSHLHPQYRDANYRWPAGHRTSPPGEFIQRHLDSCRPYLQETQAQLVEYQQRPLSPYQQPSSMPFSPSQPGWEPGSTRAMRGMSPMAPVEYGSTFVASPTVSTRQSYSQPSTSRGRDLEQTSASARQAINFLTVNDKSLVQADGTVVPADEVLVREEDKLLLTDFLFYLMKQLRLVRFSEADRKTRGGKRENIQIGYGGLQCVHCAHIAKSRKFFWSGVDRLANSFAEIPAHVFKCKYCPEDIKEALTDLKKVHAEQMARLPRGSQKVFFRRVWKRLHQHDPGQEDDQDSPAHRDAKAVPGSKDSSPDTAKGSLGAGTSGSEESHFFLERPTKEAAKALADSAMQTGPPSPNSRVLLAITEDRDFLSDMDCFIRRQLEVFCATADDVQVAQDDRKYPIKEGQVGIRCIHCSLAKSGASGHAVAYPFSVSGIFEAVREFQRLHLEYCENLPEQTKAKLNSLKESTTITSIQRRYYALAARGLGLYDTKEGGIRAGHESVPVVSQAVFSFGEPSPTVADAVARMRGEEPSPPAETPGDNRKRPAEREAAEGSPVTKKPTPDSRREDL